RAPVYYPPLPDLFPMRRILIPQATSSEVPPAGSTVLDCRGETMGTTWSVRLVDIPAAHSSDEESAGRWQQQIQAQLDTVVAQMSHWLADSDLGRFNRAPAGSWQILPEAFFEVLTYDPDIAEASVGAFGRDSGALVYA